MKLTVLKIVKFKTEPEWNRIGFSEILSFKTVANRLDPAETPSNSASQQDSNYLQIQLYFMTWWIYGQFLIPVEPENPSIL